MIKVYPKRIYGYKSTLTLDPNPRIEINYSFPIIIANTIKVAAVIVPKIYIEFS
jgi:hypothetical protein